MIIKGGWGSEWVGEFVITTTTTTTATRFSIAAYRKTLYKNIIQRRKELRRKVTVLTD